MITSSKRALPLAESRVLSEYRCTDDVKRALSSFSLLEKLGDYHIKQIDSIFPCVCTLIDTQMTSKRDKNNSYALDYVSCVLFCFLLRFDVICVSIRVQTHGKMESIC